MDTRQATAVIGLGNMGRGLARRLAGRTDLIVAARDDDAASAFAATLDGVRALPIEQALAQARIVALALHFAPARELAASVRPGSILVDMSNPVTPDFSALTIGHDTSAAEQIGTAAEGVRVVKAFNTIFAELFDASREATASVPVFLAGDDDEALEQVAQLVRSSGFAVERVGGLDGARLLEPLGMLNIRLGYGLGHGTGIAPRWLDVAA